VLGAGWTQVGTHLNERVLKPVCGGEVPHLGLAHDAEGGRLHAFDGRRMHVYDIVALVERAPERWTAWVALRGEDAPVHPIQVRRIERHITRWRGLPTGPDWASGATWLRDTEVGGLVRIEQLGCED
jgi:hypothetical protein